MDKRKCFGRILRGAFHRMGCMALPAAPCQNRYIWLDSGYLLSASGEKIAFSARVVHPLLPALWSHDGQRVATINADHQLVVMDLNGNVQIVGQVGTSLPESEWDFRGVIAWSEDDRAIKVGETVWPAP